MLVICKCGTFHVYAVNYKTDKNTEPLTHCYQRFAFRADKVPDLPSETHFDAHFCLTSSLSSQNSTKYAFISAPLDMVFVVDGYRLVGTQTFKVLKDFAKQIIHAFVITLQATRVGFAQISDAGFVNFNLDQYDEMQALDVAIDAIPLKSGSKRYTGQSVITAFKSIFLTTGRRGLVPRVLLVITTGNSEDDVRLVGQGLKEQKVISIVISVGENVNKDQGIQLATSPEHAFAQDDIANLQTIVEDVVQKINKGIVCCFCALSFCNMGMIYSLPISCAHNFSRFFVFEIVIYYTRISHVFKYNLGKTVVKCFLNTI